MTYKNGKFTIYSKNGCGWCVKAKKLLEQHGYSYEEIMLNTPSDIASFKEIFPQVKTVPQIIYYETENDTKTGKYIGGYDDLENTIMRKQ